MSSIKQDILNKIDQGDLMMRPRWQFVLQSTLMLIGAVMIALVIVYAFSFVFFILDYTGAVYGPAFGLPGIMALLLSVPWLMLFLGFIFVLTLESLVRRYAFAYHKPLLYSLLGIFLFTAAGSYVVLQTTIHDRLRSTNTPIIGGFYRGYSQKVPRDLYIGEVSSVNAKGILLDDNRRGTVYILTPEHDVRVGDMLMIFGRYNDNGEIIAKEIRTVSRRSEENGNKRELID